MTWMRCSCCVLLMNVVSMALASGSFNITTAGVGTVPSTGTMILVNDAAALASVPSPYALYVVVGSGVCNVYGSAPLGEVGGRFLFSCPAPPTNLYAFASVNTAGYVVAIDESDTYVTSNILQSPFRRLVTSGSPRTTRENGTLVTAANGGPIALLGGTLLTLDLLDVATSTWTTAGTIDWGTGSTILSGFARAQSNGIIFFAGGVDGQQFMPSKKVYSITASSASAVEIGDTSGLDMVAMSLELYDGVGFLVDHFGKQCFFNTYYHQAKQLLFVVYNPEPNLPACTPPATSAVTYRQHQDVFLSVCNVGYLLENQHPGKIELFDRKTGLLVTEGAPLFVSSVGGFKVVASGFSSSSAAMIMLSRASDCSSVDVKPRGIAGDNAEILFSAKELSGGKYFICTSLGTCPASCGAQYDTTQGPSQAISCVTAGQCLIYQDQAVAVLPQCCPRDTIVDPSSASWILSHFSQIIVATATRTKEQTPSAGLTLSQGLTSTQALTPSHEANSHTDLSTLSRDRLSVTKTHRSIAASPTLTLTHHRYSRTARHTVTTTASHTSLRRTASVTRRPSRSLSDEQSLTRNRHSLTREATLSHGEFSLSQTSTISSTPSSTRTPPIPPSVSAAPFPWLYVGIGGGGLAALLAAGLVLRKVIGARPVARKADTLQTFSEHTSLIDTSKYKLSNLLGRGGYGMVFLATRRKDQLRVAVKYITCRTEYDLQLAMREFDIIAKLARMHPNVIEILDLLMNWQEVIDTSDDVRSPLVGSIQQPRQSASPKKAAVGLLGDDVLPFRAGDSEHTAFTRPRYVAIVTRFYAEGDLKKYVMGIKSPVPEDQLMSWMAQAASVLVFLHDQKPRIVHRDIKPENILLDDHGKRIVVTDFGLAFDNQKTFMTTQAGSMPFVAPECWTKRYNEKVDIWSLGCVMYAIATMRVTGEASRIMFNDVDDPDFERTIRREVQSNGYSDGFFKILMQTLIKDFNVRPSAKEIFRQMLDHMELRGYSTEHVIKDYATVNPPSSSGSRRTGGGASPVIAAAAASDNAALPLLSKS